jgi:hypothetical protein
MHRLGCTRSYTSERQIVVLLERRRPVVMDDFKCWRLRDKVGCRIDGGTGQNSETND